MLIDLLLESSPLSAALMLAFSGLGVLGCGALATSIFARSLPGKVTRIANEAEAMATESLRKTNELRTEFAATVEQLEHYVEQVERKRRSLQGAESRLRASLEQQQKLAEAEPSDDPSERLAALRRNIYGAGGGNARG